ncbi:MAG: hypothetical protein JSR60_14205 [Proteobacteria bacterium]|nr:hypothetical protein [Pseudomonadota bacterium]
MNFARVAALCAIVLTPVLASAGPRDELVDGMAKCAAVTDNAERLACYDALSPTLKAAEAAPPAPVAAAPAPPAAPPPVADNRPWYDIDRLVGVPPSEQRTPDQFGSENLKAPPPPAGSAEAANVPPPALDSITVGVTEYSFTPFGKFIVILENGQIWQQLQSDGGEARFKRSGKNTVTITRALFGSYSLSLNGDKTFKVQRLK